MHREVIANTQRIAALLYGLGPRKSFPIARENCDLISYYLSSREPTPLEVQVGLGKLLNDLIPTLENVSARARSEQKRSAYAGVIAALEEILPPVRDAWLYYTPLKVKLNQAEELLKTLLVALDNKDSVQPLLTGRPILFIDGRNSREPSMLELKMRKVFLTPKPTGEQLNEISSELTNLLLAKSEEVELIADKNQVASLKGTLKALNDLADLFEIEAILHVHQ